MVTSKDGGALEESILSINVDPNLELQARDNGSFANYQCMNDGVKKIGRRRVQLERQMLEQQVNSTYNGSDEENTEAIKILIESDMLLVQET